MSLLPQQRKDSMLAGVAESTAHRLAVLQARRHKLADEFPSLFPPAQVSNMDRMSLDRIPSSIKGLVEKAIPNVELTLNEHGEICSRDHLDKENRSWKNETPPRGSSRPSACHPNLARRCSETLAACSTTPSEQSSRRSGKAFAMAPEPQRGRHKPKSVVKSDQRSASLSKSFVVKERDDDAAPVRSSSIRSSADLFETKKIALKTNELPSSASWSNRPDQSKQRCSKVHIAQLNSNADCVDEDRERVVGRKSLEKGSKRRRWRSRRSAPSASSGVAEGDQLPTEVVGSNISMLPHRPGLASDHGACGLNDELVSGPCSTSETCQDELCLSSLDNTALLVAESGCMKAEIGVYPDDPAPLDSSPIPYSHVSNDQIDSKVLEACGQPRVMVDIFRNAILHGSIDFSVSEGSLGNFIVTAKLNYVDAAKGPNPFGPITVILVRQSYQFESLESLAAERFNVKMSLSANDRCSYVANWLETIFKSDGRRGDMPAFKLMEMEKFFFA